MKLSNILAAIAIATVLTGCGDQFLTAHSTGQAEAGGEATEGAIVSYLASAYQILLFDSYANQNYNAVLLLSDLRSDDIYKGGGDDMRSPIVYYGEDTGISTPASDAAVVSTTYFDLMGRQHNGLVKGVNVVVVKYADGTVKSGKVIIR